jgi:hypothetical protein
MNNNLFTPAELAQCARVEVTRRRHVYREMLRQDTISLERAEREIAMMNAIADHFEDLMQTQFSFNAQ